MINQQYKLCAPCLFGLESVLSGEVKRLGFTDISVTDGRVEFLADAEGVARSNLYLRTAERVLIVLGTFRAVTFQQLIDGAEKIPFEEYIGKKNAFPVKGWSLNSQLHSVPDCQSIIKKQLLNGYRINMALHGWRKRVLRYKFNFPSIRILLPSCWTPAALHFISEGTARLRTLRRSVKHWRQGFWILLGFILIQSFMILSVAQVPF